MPAPMKEYRVESRTYYSKLTLDKEHIATASADLISTNLPSSELGTFMELALKAKDQKISTLSLVPPMIDTADPDIALVREKVAQAVATSEDPPAASASAPRKKKRAPASVTGGSIGSLSEGYAANESQDLASSC